MTSSTSSWVGRWAAPCKPAGTVSHQAQSWLLPRLGETYALKMLP